MHFGKGGGGGDEAGGGGVWEAAGGVGCAKDQEEDSNKKKALAAKVQAWRQAHGQALEAAAVADAVPSEDEDIEEPHAMSDSENDE